MTKSAVLGLLALGGGSAAAGGIYLPRILDGGSYELPSSYDLFKEEGHQKGCVPLLFDGLESLNGTGAKDATEKEPALGENYFVSEDTSGTRGCLLVNWTRHSYLGGNWKGNIRFLWAVAGENGKGLIVFLVGKNKHTETHKKLVWSGVAYTLSRETVGDNRRWRVQHKHVLPTAQDNQKELKIITGDGAQRATSEGGFPKPGRGLSIGDYANRWGFLSGDRDLGMICKPRDCKGMDRNTSSFMGYWSWIGSVDGKGASALEDWTDGLGTWWNLIFEEKKFNVKAAVAKQRGEWARWKFWAKGLEKGRRVD